MDGAEEDIRWPPPRGNDAGTRRTGRGPRGPRWVVSLRALVVVLAMLAAALGMLWLEAAGVEGVSAELATHEMGKVDVPPLGTQLPDDQTTRGGAPPAGQAGAPPEGQAGAPPAGQAGAPPEGQRGSTPGGQAGAAAPSSEGVLLVHVAGAVTSPGVVRLAPGSRVYQALEAAGGALPAAHLAALNLAAQVSDGQQILVPTTEEAAALQPPGGVGGLASDAVPGQNSGAGVPQVPLNINTASMTELETLPGVGPVLAERIITWRNDHGPFPSVDALDAVSGIGAKMLAGIRDLVRVS